MSREETNRLKYTIALIAEFADRFGIGEKQAFNYLSRFKGLAHLATYYDVIHTLSFDDAVEAMIQVCRHNGGGLR
ncbi:MAG: DUF3791 domain-containing protein [Bacteroidaceae bacterium]|nr:DUF3791 domain-containing protein [Bacteroidaceae bacterium]